MNSEMQCIAIILVSVKASFALTAFCNGLMHVCIALFPLQCKVVAHVFGSTSLLHVIDRFTKCTLHFVQSVCNRREGAPNSAETAL